VTKVGKHFPPTAKPHDRHDARILRRASMLVHRDHRVERTPGALDACLRKEIV